jgi:hypothetical protein
MSQERKAVSSAYTIEIGKWTLESKYRGGRSRELLSDVATAFNATEEVKSLLAAALEDVRATEWVGLPFYMGTEHVCPVCQMTRAEGHANDCAKAAVLAAALNTTFTIGGGK